MNWKILVDHVNQETGEMIEKNHKIASVANEKEFDRNF